MVREIKLRTRWFDITISNARQKSREVQEAGIWTTGKGEQIYVADMTDSHLTNSLKMMDRIVAETVNRKFPSPWSTPAPQGEMAQMAYDQECADWDDGGYLMREIYAAQLYREQPIYALMQDEFADRGLTGHY
jgi:uncharacterized glyoxalase superfamily metalloenzyme YdcJ